MKGSRDSSQHGQIASTQTPHKIDLHDNTGNASLWNDPTYPDYPLETLVRLYSDHLLQRTNKPAPGTVVKYTNTLRGFLGFLEHAHQPLILKSLTCRTVNLWVAQQRSAHKSEDGIASRLSEVKVFTRKFICDELELTSGDVLADVKRISLPVRIHEVLTQDELDHLLGCFDRDTFEDIRDHALIASYLCSGLRLSELITVRLEALDRVTGCVTVCGKGGDHRQVTLSPRALKLVKRYLKERRSTGSDRLWVTREGQPIGSWAVQSLMRRLRQRTGIARLHTHLLRHTFAQAASDNGLERAMLKEVLGHRTDAMTLLYEGRSRQKRAARIMTDFSPI